MELLKCNLIAQVLTYAGRARVPTPQKPNALFVEQAGKPVQGGRARVPTPQAENSLFVEQAREACSCPGGLACPPHKQKIHSLWNRPESLFLENSARCSIAHQGLSTFIYTEKFKIFDRNDRPRPDFRIELLSSVSFH